MRLITLPLYRNNVDVNWQEFQNMDPHLLVGLINTEIRNHCDDLDDLCKTHDVDLDLLLLKCKEAGYDYFPELKCFR